MTNIDEGVRKAIERAMIIFGTDPERRERVIKWLGNNYSLEFNESIMGDLKEWTLYVPVMGLVKVQMEECFDFRAYDGGHISCGIGRISALRNEKLESRLQEIDRCAASLPKHGFGCILDELEVVVCRREDSKDGTVYIVDVRTGSPE